MDTRKTVGLYAANNPLGRALKKAGLGKFWCPEEIGDKFINDGNPKENSFFQLLVSLYVSCTDTECPDSIFVSLDSIYNTSLSFFAGPVARAISVLLRELQGACKVKIFVINPVNEPVPNTVTLPIELPSLLDPSDYPPVDTEITRYPILDAEIDRLLKSKNHSPLGTFDFYEGCLLGARALKLFGLCLLSTPDGNKQTVIRLFKNAFYNEPMDNEDIDRFNSWRFEMIKVKETGE